MERPSVPIVVVGSGRMSREYVRTLRHAGFTGEQIRVRSSHEDRARVFAEECGIACWQEGIVAPLAIIAVAPDKTPDAVRRQVADGARYVLVEKPGALSSAALRQLDKDLESFGAIAYLALNRRFYPSVMEARRLLESDGGVINCHVEFTDLEAHVKALMAEGFWASENFQRWGLINPVHPLDLTFFLAGAPVTLSSYRTGSLEWHSAGSEFSGSGRTASGALFSYSASFGGAGRWRVELTSRRRRLLFCPLEELRQQGKDGFSLDLLSIATEPATIKPGLAALIDAFLHASGSGIEHPNLVRLEEGASILEQVESIFGYA
ncbi:MULTISPECIES: Gfo/Idh/MocA family protein [unclassified Cyanobium]|uniref:Gfo/Idh/MocA family protein n=1 Tax=unclassified Cyanobium TaxID=2627006 RepID=UPI0020CC47D1|nr:MULTISPECIES: Gfo/Idh/MocA family oxidoreductase [unclassified Cyanobium]